MTSDQSNAPNVYPALRYRDARAAIAWLGDAFGFAEVAVHVGEDGQIAHAELSLGQGIVMLGTAGEGMASVGSPALTANGEPDFSRIPFSIYVAVDDVDRHHERARAAGAIVVRDLQDTDYGSREYSALDLEGNVWSFGTYRPVVG